MVGVRKGIDMTSDPRNPSDFHLTDGVPTVDNETASRYHATFLCVLLERMGGQVIINHSELPTKRFRISWAFDDKGNVIVKLSEASFH